jgi:hypothetical protein
VETVVVTEAVTVEDTKVEIVAVTEAVTVEDTKVEIVAETEAVTVEDTKVEIVAETEAVTVEDTKVEIVAETEVVTVAETEAEIVEDTKVEIVVETEVATVVVTEAEIVVVTEVETVAEIVVVTEVETVAETAGVVEEPAQEEQNLVLGKTVVQVEAETEDLSIAQKETRIIHSKDEETNYNVRPHFVQYISLLNSSRFIEYEWHSGHGGRPVLRIALRKRRGLGKRGHPLFGLRTFGITPPLTSTRRHPSSIIPTNDQMNILAYCI